SSVASPERLPLGSWLDDPPVGAVLGPNGVQSAGPAGLAEASLLSGGFMDQPQRPPARPAQRPKKGRGGRLVTYVLVGMTLLGLLAFVGSIGVIVWMVSSGGKGGQVNDNTWLFARFEGAI